MITAVKTFHWVAANETDALFTFRITPNCLKTKKVWVNSNVVDVSICKRKSLSILNYSSGVSFGDNTSPNKRLIDFEHEFEEDEELIFKVKTNSTITGCNVSIYLIS